MMRRTLACTVIVGLAIMAWGVFSPPSPLGEKFWGFLMLAAIPAAVALIATVWAQPKDVFDIADKLMLTLVVMFVCFMVFAMGFSRYGPSI